MDAADDERRRVIRDLHDGAQQRLVQTIVTLKLLLRALDEDPGSARELAAEALDRAIRSNMELRDLVRGILPASLTRGGLRAAVEELVSNAHVPTTIDLPTQRFSRVVEASAYFVVAEAITNALKHARARHVAVSGHFDDGTLTVEISDDGIGGADRAGHGIVGLEDRVSALGGQLLLESPREGGTVVRAVLPLSG